MFIPGVLQKDFRYASAVGVTLGFIGYFAFALNDALGKYLLISFGVPQIVALRSVGGLLILVPLLIRGKENPFHSVDRPALQFVRALLATLDTALFYAACVYLPLADVFTFYMAGPIYTTVASYLFLGERVGWRRWIAIMMGFVGVLIALRPSSAVISFAALYAVSGSISYSLALIINKKLASTNDASLVIYQTVLGLVGGSLLAIPHWRPLSLFGTSAMLLLGVIGTAGHLMLTRSVKLASVSSLAPIQYTLLLWGILLGFVFFDEVPSKHTLIGAGIIVTAGLFIFYRKSKAGTIDPATDLPPDCP